MTESSVASDRTDTTLHRDTASSWANATILMGVFTGLWGTVGTMYMPEPWTYLVFGVIGLASLVLIVGGFRLLRPARSLRPPDAEEEAQAAHRGRVLGLSLGVEVALLAVGFPLLAVAGLGHLMAPYGALVVGLHFLPFGRVFGRVFDYFVGGWTIVWAVVTLVMVAFDPDSRPVAWTIVGLAASAATIAYGAQMLAAVQKALSGHSRREPA